MCCTVALALNYNGDKKIIIIEHKDFIFPNLNCSVTAEAQSHILTNIKS